MVRMIAVSVLVSVLSTSFAAQVEAEHPKPARGGAGLFERVAVLGASVSAGFGLEQEVGARVRLAAIIDAALRVKHEPVQDHAELLFFAMSSDLGAQSVAAARKRGATLAVAVDFLFWFAYGEVEDEAQRLVRLDEGLGYLDRLECPIVVGDLPDMSRAVGKMLQSNQVPRPETLARLNKRLREWARTRRRVVIVPLAALLTTLQDGKELRVGSWSARSTSRLLQGDELHTTLEGSAVIAVLALHELARAREDVAADAFVSDPTALAATVRSAVRTKEPAQEEPATTGLKKAG